MDNLLSAALQPDLLGGRALPLRSYVDPDLHRRELERVFRSDWVFVGTTAELPNPGDHKPLLIGGQPLLLLRDSEGRLRALSNLCAHRGTLLVEAPGNASRFQCPYHAWTFGEDGALLSAPFAPEIDRTTHCLPTYRVESWHGLVFVCLGPSAGSLLERMAPFEEVMRAYGVHDLEAWPDFDTSEELEANWKLIYSNAAESYHLFKVHSETLEPYTPTKSARYVDGSALGTLCAGEVRDGKRGKSLGEYHLIAFPPNLVFVLDGQALLWQAVDPISPTRSRVRTGGFWGTAQPTGLRKLAASIAASVWGSRLGDFLPEDRLICERGQRAASGEFEPGQLADVERVIRDFHAYLAWRLYEIEPGQVAGGAA